jgi:hypothetical protein
MLRIQRWPRLLFVLLGALLFGAVLTADGDLATAQLDPGAIVEPPHPQCDGTVAGGEGVCSGTGDPDTGAPIEDEEEEEKKKCPEEREDCP